MSEENKSKKCSVCGCPITGIDLILKETLCISCKTTGQELLNKIRSGAKEIKPFSSKDFTYPWNLKK